ncbi:DUF3035 domain-containing protein [Sphingobium nicotianae]|uniref:DUF3035 domain-containing protein n=1 Tax=Sphingobium nicotianae TaxID=2782607 RepID=A0A9X1DDL8_9SPHN|nr:DUF3035 domain-containing protein [Sphingobium nicotianae]MBT2187970.1 DUF3035 domain-containing protein [Sphingobium nicotianae]
MHHVVRLSVAIAGISMLAGCGATSLFNRDRPDEMAVSRQPPLVIPPDFALTPPAPGTAAAQQNTLQQNALEAMFGGTAPRSPGETSALRQAGRSLAEIGIRSSVGDPSTEVVDKGATTQDIVTAPEGDGQFARVVASAQ